MMGNPGEALGSPSDGQLQPAPHQQKQHKATFSGLTAMVGVLAFIADIISVSVPHWGTYSPVGASYFAAGNIAQDNTGHFGPFQSCKYQAYYSYCGGAQNYQATVWLTIAGICAVVSLVSLALFSLFAVLHVAMQLQRREIMVSFSRAVFLKVVFSSIAVIGTVAATIFGGVHFGYGGRFTSLALSMGIMYYIQIILIFVTLLLVILSFLSWRQAKKNPLPIVPRHHSSSSSSGQHPYETRNSNGVTMTNASGSPYNHSRHGQPRLPSQPQPQTAPYNNSYAQQQQQQQQQQLFHQQQQQQYFNGSGQQGYTNNGFTSVGLSVPMQQQAMPMQPIRPIQPVQGIPQASMGHFVNEPYKIGSMAPMQQQQQQQYPQQQQHLPTMQQQPGVSFAPGGKSGTGGAGYTTSMQQHPTGLHGSMESLESTNSSSNFSYTSTVSTGSGHHPLRSSLKKPKNRDKVSVSSESSSKRVRLSLGAEQTSV